MFTLSHWTDGFPMTTNVLSDNLPVKRWWCALTIMLNDYSDVWRFMWLSLRRPYLFRHSIKVMQFAYIYIYIYRPHTPPLDLFAHGLGNRLPFYDQRKRDNRNDGGSAIREYYPSPSTNDIRDMGCCTEAGPFERSTRGGVKFQLELQFCYALSCPILLLFSNYSDRSSCNCCSNFFLFVDGSFIPFFLPRILPVSWTFELLNCCE